MTTITVTQDIEIDLDDVVANLNSREERELAGMLSTSAVFEATLESITEFCEEVTETQAIEIVERLQDVHGLAKPQVLRLTDTEMEAIQHSRRVMQLFNSLFSESSNVQRTTETLDAILESPLQIDSL